MHRYRLGVDLGGTKIEIAALSADGTQALRRRIATPQGDYRATLDAIVTLVDDVENALGVAPGSSSIGIGTPGALSQATGRLRNSNSVCLNGEPLKADLESRLGRAIRISNDANCFAVSEASDGAAQGAHVVFGVILGTGVGAGIVIEGRPLEGRNAIAGEWGHNPLPWPTDDERPGADCYCGRHGCIETWLAGPSFERDYAARGGGSAGASEIAARAEAGEGIASEALARYADRLARGLAHVINILDPDVIVLGGGMSNVAALYTSVPAQWGRWIFSDAVSTRLVRNRHGDSSGVLGAARLWPAAQTSTSTCSSARRRPRA